NLRYPFFQTFDAPDSNETCARRHVSTSAPQALMLLNDKMTLDLARSFAGRVLREAPEGVVEQAYRLALGRAPSPNEAKLAENFLAQEKIVMAARLQAKQAAALLLGAPPPSDSAMAAAVVDFCHVLLNLNEYAYVD